MGQEEGEKGNKGRGGKMGGNILCACSAHHSVKGEKREREEVQYNY